MRAAALLLCCVCVTSAAAQTPTDYFDREGRKRGRGIWSIGAGASSLFATPRTHASTWTFAGADGFADTAHTGTWAARGHVSPLLLVSRLRVLRRPLLVDRLSLTGTLFRESTSATFTGLLATPGYTGTTPDTLAVSSSTFAAAAEASAWAAVPLTPDLFLDLGLGLRLSHRFGPGDRLQPALPRGADSLFLPTATPGPQRTRAALTASAGLGVRVWRGQFLRLILSTDLLQLHPEFASGASFFLLHTPYRPFALSLRYEFQPLRPPVRCAGTPEGQPGKHLFDPEMRKRYGFLR
jgi:hypothetical protein